MRFETYDEVPNHLNQQCGFCNTPVNFVKLTNAFSAGDNGELFGAKEKYYSALYRCPNCGKPSLIVFGARDVGGGSKYHVRTQYPRYSPEKMNDVPVEIENDRYEAWKCYFGGCFKSSAIMARAALQRAVRVLKAKDGSLYNEIEDLKNKGVITKQLADFAHEVRITGNDMAHPEEMSTVDKKEIEESLDFLDGFLETVFILPAIAERRRKAREEK
jgi:hypothetical protein